MMGGFKAESLKESKLVGPSYFVDSDGWLYKYVKSKEKFLKKVTRTKKSHNQNCVFEVGRKNRRKFTVSQLKKEYYGL